MCLCVLCECCEAACCCCKCCFNIFKKLVEYVGELVAHIIVGLISLIILGGFIVLILWLAGVIACGPNGCSTNDDTVQSTRVARDLAGMVNPKFGSFVKDFGL